MVQNRYKCGISLYMWQNLIIIYVTFATYVVVTDVVNIYIYIYMYIFYISGLDLYLTFLQGHENNIIFEHCTMYGGNFVDTITH